HPPSVVATTRRLPSDSGAFADWAAPSSSAGRAPPDDLSLGFNAAPAVAPPAGPPAPLWSAAAAAQRSLNYGLGSEMGMVGLRDVYVVAPAASFNPNPHHHDPNLISDDHSLAASNSATALGVGVGVGVIPLLTAGPCLGVEEDNLLGSRSGSRGGGIQLWQQNQQSTQHYLKKTPSSSLDHHLHNASGTNNDLIGGGIGVFGGLASSSSATTTCQDCGNQAKKDCSRGRCRTCCRSRGFDCATHVKSTWVPAARRRERQLMAITGTAADGSSGSASGTKKPRLIASQTTSHTSTSNTTPPGSIDTSSSHQDAGFKEELPGQIRAPAVFKCVRVTAVDDGEDEYAYQAVVKIGGHVFKGFLYDQGVEAGDGFPNVSELHLSDGGGGSRNNRNGSSSAPFVDPSDVYNAAASGNGGAPGFLGGSNYGNQIR
ncbi:protein LATERAL ROOT PRIMORDIUM 1-like, partial [Cucurbita pepo subsp. pepo]|uniref:protein LATERAL ROOT PRIMORDIUM 1-like n=1 Tax=Cucurbita pepo subsp. pepo TaxID=3664 RepID=UPI000C9D73E3